MTPNKRADGHRQDSWAYECVDPALGRELWRLDDPYQDEVVMNRLRNHLAMCDACRLQQSLGPLLAESLSATRPSPFRFVPKVLAYSGGLLIAASLALLMLLPPRPRNSDLIMRDSTETVIERPCDGEVIYGHTPRLNWKPIKGATSYRITLDEIGGDFAWHAQTQATSLGIPQTVTLPPNGIFRFMVEPVPEDLAPPGGWASSFMTGGLQQWLRYRLSSAAIVVKLLGLLGACSALFAGLMALIHRP